MSTVSKRIDYPTSDGKPMAETDAHRAVIMDSIAILDDFYSDQPMVYVSGDLLLFYKEGDRRVHLAPDVFVVFDVEKRQRDNFLLWEERCGPQFVLEVTSKSTRQVDIGKKHHIYQDVLRVPEYFLFDPLGEYLKPALKGYRLQGPDYQPIASVDGRLPSDVTGFHLVANGKRLDFYDPRTRTVRKTPVAAARETAQIERAGRERAEADRERAEAGRERAEAELAELRAELSRLRGGESEASH